MKKLLMVFLASLMVCGIFAGCSSSGSESDLATLADIKKAAEDAGYAVKEEFEESYFKDITDGFSVEVTVDDTTTVYHIAECKNESAAKKNETRINNAMYNVAVRNGKIISFYASSESGKKGPEILKTIVNGNPTPKS